MTTHRAADAPGLTFILGFPRSGTTLLGQILATLPQVLLLEERGVLTATASAFVVERDGLERLAALTPDAARSYTHTYWQALRAQGFDPGDRMVVDQTALNTIYLPAIAKIFTDAKVVFAIRDPRDVVLSCFRRKFEPNPFTLEFHSLESAAELYDRTMQLALLSRERLGASLIDVRYEDLIANFDGATQRLCTLLGLPWSAAMRDFHLRATGENLTTASAPQVRRSLNAEGVGAWRGYRDHMTNVLPVLAPWVARFGYPAD